MCHQSISAAQATTLAIAVVAQPAMRMIGLYRRNAIYAIPAIKPGMTPARYSCANTLGNCPVILPGSTPVSLNTSPVAIRSEETVMANGKGVVRAKIDRSRAASRHDEDDREPSALINVS